MVIRVNELKLHPDHTKKDLEQELCRVLRLKKIPEYEIIRQSVDARKKPDLYFSYTIDVSVPNPKAVLKQAKTKKAVLAEKKTYKFPYRYEEGQLKAEGNRRPVVVGSGPAGLFCALMLARAGLHPIVLERGEAVEQRLETVEQFWKTGKLNPQSNVQFGEGGAGTFSDGKLNTLVKDTEGRIRFVLHEFVKAGAKEEILYHYKPHIGTDVLVGVVRSIRNEILSLGGEVRFGCCFTGMKRMTEQLWRLELNNGAEYLETEHLVLAIGHSARDTFQMLYEKNLQMQPKAFAVGLRIEHKQSWINDAMYGSECPYELGAAPYKVTHKCEDGRGVYSFCMCPGGYVVNASSEDGRTAVNGMSYSDRGSENANSAIVVTVSPEDYQAETPLSGIEFQRRLEEAAWKCAGGSIPVQRLEDFEKGVATETFGKIQPVMKGKAVPANVREILPEYLNQDLLEGIYAFGSRIPGFSDPDVLLSGVESRTSSPVRILRDENGMSLPGIYPCGEGAGYAGGITSAAADGVRVAEAVCARIF